MILGVDEVGRGCWAGPLVAGAVLLADDQSIPGLTDSKLLSAKRRQLLAVDIQIQAEAVRLGWVWPKEINMLGLTKSVELAMKRAVEKIHTSQIRIIVDGSINYLSWLPDTECIVKADLTVPAVSAASVIAKVARDEYMTNFALKYPKYGFEKHVGYGTKLHLEALKLYGVLPIHRVNYKPIQKLLAEST